MISTTKNGVYEWTPMTKQKSSRLHRFYEKPFDERIQLALQASGLPLESEKVLKQRALTSELLDTFIENAIGGFEVPLGIATNFLIDGRETLVPMAVEESSVVAAASYGALLTRKAGGFTTKIDDPVMIGQIQLFVTPGEVDEKIQVLEKAKLVILEKTNSKHSSLVARGGGAVDLNWRYIPEINSLVVHLYVHTCEAMGANIVNTACEYTSQFLSDMLGVPYGLRILSNLSDSRVARSACRVPKEYLGNKQFSSEQMIDGIVSASMFAEHDIYRATTHNKGVMNGVDPVVIATGNDWRAVEAGAHAFAAQQGGYKPLATWRKDENGDLVGNIAIPLAIGTVGGVTRLHPGAKFALGLMGHPNSKELASIICSVGLAQNLSALKALATEGIQEGHMSLHQKNLLLQHKNGLEQTHVGSERSKNGRENPPSL